MSELYKKSSFKSGFSTVCCICIVLRMYLLLGSCRSYSIVGRQCVALNDFRDRALDFLILWALVCDVYEKLTALELFLSCLVFTLEELRGAI